MSVPRVYIEKLDILYADEHFVAVDKPCWTVVHKSGEASDRYPLMKLLRDQLGRRVYPAHRLDRQTSGALLFALSSEAAKGLSALFASGLVEKRYIAVVRGWLEAPLVIDRPLKNWDTGEMQAASTLFTPLERGSLPIPAGPFETSRYSLIEAAPKTGRRHQIRRHLRGAAHPIIGDVKHGDTEHNNIFRETLKTRRMLLHARSLSFTHPETKELVRIEAAPPKAFEKVFRRFGWMGRIGPGEKRSAAPEEE